MTARIFSLERIVGPGTSVAENFEIASLALMQAADPDGSYYRMRSPDSGIDIVGDSSSGVRQAIQCKAYSRYSASLLSKIQGSVTAALDARATLDWERYSLVIAFVPTFEQRQRIEQALKPCGKFSVIDSDEIETRLIGTPAVATRFFPSIKIVYNSRPSPITLKIDEGPELALILRSERTGQAIPLRVSESALAGGLVRLLIGVMHLPEYATVQMQFLGDEVAPIEWHLAHYSATDNRVEVDDGESLSSANVRTGDEVGLIYRSSLSMSGGFRKSLFAPDPWKRVEITSRIFDEDELESDLVRRVGPYYMSTEETLHELLENYIDYQANQAWTKPVRSMFLWRLLRRFRRWQSQGASDSS